MRKIIHFSDLHIGYRDMGEQFRRIVSDVVFTKEPARDYVIVITGDLVEAANLRRSYAEARSHVETLRAAGFTVLVAPGNHDYGTGNLGWPKYVRRFKEAFLGRADVEYPKLDVIEGMAFLGLDSMAEELHWYDRMFAEGELGEEQLDRLAKALRSRAVRRCSRRVVYLHHHPFDPEPLNELKDSDALGRVIRSCGGVDALLYGHNHAGKTRNGKWGIRRCYDGGTATHKDGWPGPHRVMDLSRDPRLDYDADFGWGP